LDEKEISEVSNFSELLESILECCFCSKNTNNAINSCTIAVVLFALSQLLYKYESMRTRKIAHKGKKP
jgi:hypothetical protein